MLLLLTLIIVVVVVGGAEVGGDCHHAAAPDPDRAECHAAGEGRREQGQGAQGSRRPQSRPRDGALRRTNTGQWFRCA